MNRNDFRSDTRVFFDLNPEKRSIQCMCRFFAFEDKTLLKIGNNKGKTNGWTNKNNIFGKIIKVEKKLNQNVKTVDIKIRKEK